MIVRHPHSVLYNSCQWSLNSIALNLPLTFVSAWAGWFPVLFNTTEFIAELHRRSHPELNPEIALEEGTRLGSRALFYSAILSLIANVALPFFVAEAASRKDMQARLLSGPQSIWMRWFEKLKIHLAPLWAASHLLFAICMTATL